MSHVTNHRRHWLVVISCCLMVAVSLGLFTNAYGVFYTPLAEKLGTGRGAVAVHATIAGMVTAFSQPLMVRMLDKVRLQWLLLTGMVLMAGTTVLTVLADSVWLLDLIGVVRGIGIGCCYVPVVTTVLGNWFFKSYGLISGITLSFSGLSGAILSQVLTGMLSRYGMQTTLLIVTGGIIVLLLPALLFVRTRPEDAGLRPYGEKETPAASGDTIFPALPMKSGTVLLIICLAGASSALLFSFPQHLTSYTQTLGLGAEIGASMMSAVMVGNILSKLLSGVLVDLIGAFRSAAVFLTAATLAMLVLFFYPKSYVVLMIAAFFLGSAYAYNSVGLANVTRAVFGSGYGKAFSIVNAVSCVSSSVLLSVIGFSYDLTGGYRLASAASVACGALGLVCTGILRKKLRTK